jgi:pimeloyl-ACP methyl ester carboxylesterase
MGKYDIPAILDYITNNTSQPSLYYIGHSLGTTQLFTAATLNPGLQSKIRTFFALAPVAYKGNRTNIAFRASAPVYGPYPGEVRLHLIRILSILLIIMRFYF